MKDAENNKTSTGCSDTFCKASFQVLPDGTPFAVHFNPQTLQYTISNTLKNTGSGNATKQYVDKSTGKLTLDLIYDTTHSGKDVRRDTLQVARLMEPKGKNKKKKTPPQVKFDWGLFTFTGMLEGYKETIDFFSADGVPLRASVNLTLASQDKVFEGGTDNRSARGITGPDSTGKKDSETAVEAELPPKKDGRGVSVLAERLGDPRLARDLAKANGEENMRFPRKNSLSVDEDTASSPPQGLTAQRPTPGAEADKAAAKNAFSGLRSRPSSAAARTPDTSRLRQSVESAEADTQSPGAFADDGRARSSASGSQRTDVGRPGNLASRLEFDGGQ